MKVCGKCQVEKSLSDFNKNKRKSDGLQSFCRDCAKDYNNSSYKTSTKRRNKIRERNEQTKKYNREFLRKLRYFVGCQVCGEKEPIALDFHHLNMDEKDYNLSKMFTYSIKTLRKEVYKCAILCSNCHRKVHAGLIEL